MSESNDNSVTNSSDPTNKLKGFRSTKMPSKRQVLADTQNQIDTFDKKLSYLNQLVTGLYEGLRMLANDRARIDANNNGRSLLQSFQVGGLINLLLDKKIISDNDLEIFIRKENSEYMKSIETNLDAEMKLVESNEDIKDNSIVSLQYNTYDENNLMIGLLSFDWIQIDMSDPSIFPTLKDMIRGMKSGEIKNTQILIPETFTDTRYSGKTYNCNVKIFKVKEKQKELENAEK